MKNLEITKIESSSDLAAALERADVLWGSEPNTPKGDELERLVELIEAYESQHYPINSAAGLKDTDR